MENGLDSKEAIYKLLEFIGSSAAARRPAPPLAPGRGGAAQPQTGAGQRRQPVLHPHPLLDRRGMAVAASNWRSSSSITIIFISLTPLLFCAVDLLLYEYIQAPQLDLLCYPQFFHNLILICFEFQVQGNQCFLLFYLYCIYICFFHSIYFII